ncbi:hypothetical protein GCM10023339_69310 [Alloalcanivorax gelatiniphagus]
MAVTVVLSLNASAGGFRAGAATGAATPSTASSSAAARGRRPLSGLNPLFTFTWRYCVDVIQIPCLAIDAVRT